MLTRRAFGKILGASAAALALPKSAGAADAGIMVPGAVDVHVHIMGDVAKYPYAATRVYTPPQATVADLKALRARIGTARNVIVTPSVYGFDNRCTVDAIAELGSTARGVAVLPVDVSTAELARLEAAGMRGTRLNTANPALTDQLAAFAPKFKPIGWHIQIVGQIGVFVALAPQIDALGIPIVADHFGGAAGERGVEDKEFQAFLEMVKAGNTYVKLSSPYDRTKQPGYANMTPFARALIAARPDRMLWGTNWPHPSQDRSIPITETSPYQRIDNEMLVTRFGEWCPDAATRKIILVDNPVRLYRFA